MAPTRVAAINFNGITMHTSLQIPVVHFGSKLPILNDQTNSSLRNKLCKVKLIFFDEISMVSNDLLYYVHLQLVEMFGSPDSKPFAG